MAKAKKKWIHLQQEKEACDHQEELPTVPDKKKPGCTSMTGMKKRKREGDKVKHGVLHRFCEFGSVRTFQRVH